MAYSVTPQREVNVKERRLKYAALVDRGANGGIAGRDTRLIKKLDQTIDLTGVNDHTVRNLDIVQAGAVVSTQHGEIIIVLNQYAWMPDSKTIHSSGQLEHYKNVINDKS